MNLSSTAWTGEDAKGVGTGACIIPPPPPASQLKPTTLFVLLSHQPVDLPFNIPDSRLQKELEETAKILPQQGSGIYTSQLLVMSVVDSVSLSNTDNHAALSVNEFEKPGEESRDPPKGIKKPRICRFFKQGSCKKGAACSFRHPERKHDDQKGEEVPLATQGGNQDEDGAEKPTPQKPRMQIQTFLRLSELTDEDLPRLRQTEIQQLKKRFPDALEMENEGDPSIYRVVVHPTDPDWPYNLIDFHLNVSFPFEYPVEMPCISLPEDQDSPTVILSHMTLAAQEWLQAKYEMNKMSGRVELIFRPFLRWFDKNVEKLFTEGARKFKKEVDDEKAGFEFIANLKDDAKPREPAQPSLPKDAVIISKPKSQQTMEEKEADKNEELASAVSGMQVDSEEDEEEQRSSDEDTSSAAKVIFDPPDKDMRGTEVIFQGLKLSEAVGTLAVTRLTVIVQCVRCKERVDVTTPPRRNNLITCGRCNNRQIVTYRPCLVHPMSHVIGFLTLRAAYRST
ncbi:hypothetical protein BSL78_26407 [Apostichopus japonicus]|uniref:Nucleoporin NUP42 n=1 Tax=Stichopus japonicus TaxID=307972 RepID=A0A2G8JM17_STIJA|nr:hypothetical protein BSL78_26407 [Apostichopus japonicus]